MPALSSNVYSKDLSIPVGLGASAKPRGCAHAPHQTHHLRDRSANYLDMILLPYHIVMYYHHTRFSNNRLKPVVARKNAFWRRAVHRLY